MFAVVKIEMLGIVHRRSKFSWLAWVKLVPSGGYNNYTIWTQNASFSNDSHSKVDAIPTRSNRKNITVLQGGNFVWILIINEKFLENKKKSKHEK